MANDVRREQIAVAAERLLLEQGRDGLTMRRVAAALGVRAPSLYKHLSGKEEIETLLASRGWAALEAAMGRSSDAAAEVLRFARERPALYRLMADRPPPRLPAVSLERLALGHGLALLELAGAKLAARQSRPPVAVVRGPD
jgi:AcrR family transcriptional regulator